MKKLFRALSLTTVTALGLVACSNGESTPNTSQTPSTENENYLKVGMVTDAGTIDDKSFNQGTWEGILAYQKDHPSTEIQFLKPDGDSTEDFLNAIDNLVLAGFKTIVTPGFKFEEAIGTAQERYSDVNFVLIDGEPQIAIDYEGCPVYEVGENTVSVFFTEHEAGFLAGIASALESKTGKVGFIGGVQVPAVQKLGWGFVSGVAYANENLGTSVEVADYIYQGTFTDVDAGKSIAGGMYDKGIDIIMHAAGGVGVGAINETKTRASEGDEVYIVGVDVDQYEEGLLADGRSVILTSAMKYLGEATYRQLEAIENGSFKGGETLLMDVQSNGVGLPKTNPNLSEETSSKVNEVFELIQSGEIQVPSSVESLDAFLTEMNYEFSRLEY